ncbi:MAG: glycosyltransferase family 39 protein [Deltaproteobacteria bacterium]|nr:glycosyltransferase family 39 protein [Deltaproteobacteria bacterium]
MGRAAGVFLAYSVVTAWWLWPLPQLASTHLLYGAGESRLVHADVYLIVWSLAWDTHALLTAPWNLFHANAFYPAPFALAYSEHFLGWVPLFAPFYLATGNPVLATNAVVFLLHPLCGIGLFLLARRFVSAPAAFLGGLLYAFYPARLETLHHFHVLGVGYLPLALLCTELWLERGRTRHAVGLAVALGLQMLCSFYLAYGSAFAYAAYLPLALYRWRARLDGRRVRGLGVALAAAAAPFLLASLPYVWLRSWGLIPSYGAEGLPSFGLSPQIANAAVAQHLLGGGIGWIGTALAIAALAPPWSGARWPRILAIALLVLGTFLALGPAILIEGQRFASPYVLLQEWVPGFGAIRSTRRFLFVAQLGLALLAALGAERLLRARPPRAAWAGALAIAALTLASYAPLPKNEMHRRPSGAEVGEAYHWLAEHGEGRPLLELPPRGFLEAARRMYLSTFHWLPIVQGYSAYSPDSATYLVWRGMGLPREESFAQLTDAVDVGWILVHRDQIPDGGKAWDGALPEGLEIERSFGGDLLVRVGRRSVSDARAHLFDTERTLGGIPLEPIGEACPGEIRLTAPIYGVQPAGSALPVKVTIENRGERTWPGLGFVPRHLVRAMACFGFAGEPCVAESEPLLQDVPPGGSVKTMLLVKVPKAAGDYRLFVRLLQVGDGFLEECGVSALEIPIRAAPRLADGPPGSYWESCGACTWDGTTLACTCADGKGGLRETRRSQRCAKGYANRDGDLICEGE